MIVHLVRMPHGATELIRARCGRFVTNCPSTTEEEARVTCGNCVRARNRKWIAGWHYR